MKTSIYSHNDCERHDPKPELGFAPARMKVAIAALKAAIFTGLDWREAPSITEDILRLVHTEPHIEAVLAPIAGGEQVAFDIDTFASSGTADAARRSAGLVMQAVRDVVTGATDQAFCIVSPGGHHAEAEAVIGYCFFNHGAMAAMAAQKLFSVGKIAIVDIDAHHANGTQSIFWNHPELLCISVHQDNPQSGFADETGAWDNILNVPLPVGSGGAVMHNAMMQKVLPKLRAFKPDLILVSAGFDMHQDDPLSDLCLVTEDYFWLGEMLHNAAQKLCNGRLVAIMEGGYNLSVLGASIAQFVQGIMGEK